MNFINDLCKIAKQFLEAVLKLLGEKKRVEKAYSSVQIQVMQITLKRKDKDEYAKAISDKCHPRRNGNSLSSCCPNANGEKVALDVHLPICDKCSMASCI